MLLFKASRAGTQSHGPVIEALESRRLLSGSAADVLAGAILPPTESIVQPFNAGATQHRDLDSSVPTLAPDRSLLHLPNTPFTSNLSISNIQDPASPPSFSVRPNGQLQVNLDANAASSGISLTFDSSVTLPAKLIIKAAGSPQGVYARATDAGSHAAVVELASLKAGTQAWGLTADSLLQQGCDPNTVTQIDFFVDSTVLSASKRNPKLYLTINGVYFTALQKTHQFDSYISSTSPHTPAENAAFRDAVAKDDRAHLKAEAKGLDPAHLSFFNALDHTYAKTGNISPKTLAHVSNALIEKLRLEAGITDPAVVSDLAAIETLDPQQAANFLDLLASTGVMSSAHRQKPLPL